MPTKKIILEKKAPAHTAGIVKVASIFFFLMMACAAVRGGQNITLKWKGIVEPDLAGYKLYYGPASGTYTNYFSTGKATNVVLSGLTAGLTYYFAATAYTTNGIESVPSNEIAVTVPGVLFMDGGAAGGNPSSVRFPVIPGNAYTLQASTDLKSWTTVWSTSSATTQWIYFTDTNSLSIKARFYRLLMQ
ncbi:MAG TPA: fibronectin type III domain-containing protein [Verrucomicrobiae bacterium]|nr:fibronectin type III domain-containing protein [Verrucomicrobiae bacterium]